MEVKSGVPSCQTRKACLKSSTAEYFGAVHDNGFQELLVDAKVAEVLAESLNLRDFAAEERFVVVPCVKLSSRSLSAFSYLCRFNLRLSTDKCHRSQT